MTTLHQSVSSIHPDKIMFGGSAYKSSPVMVMAGSLHARYEKGTLRYISSGKTELIRMIYSALRDRNWVTIHPTISDEKIEKTENSFRITLRCNYSSGEINFIANYTIEGNQENAIVFTMEGEALSDFEKNRIGFCVLHPVEGNEGKNCVVEHTDGSSVQSFFPEEISPNQVFRDIKSMKWMCDGLNCTLTFDGDVFETEDQRNWTDTSFKTYSTPLSIPYPVKIEKGTRIFQKITLTVAGSHSGKSEHDEKIIIKLFPEETLRLPSIGICQSSRSNPLNSSEIKLLRALKFDHFRVDLHLFENNWIEKAEQADRESTDLGFPVEFALFVDDNAMAQVTKFIKWHSEKKPLGSTIILYHKSQPSTPDLLARTIIPTLREADPDIDLVTGTNANFAQLNRNRPGDTGNDYICYSIHPQEHASDNTTLVENLKAQEYSVITARRIAEKKGIMITPVTLQRRFNASNTLYELTWSGTGVPPQVDSRVMSLFGACWTVGSLKYLCTSGADSITYYETVGERGIIQGDYPSRWPSEFPAPEGMIFPVYHVFKFLLGNKDLGVVKSISSKPLITECLALTDGRKARVMLVNFSDSAQPVSIDCCSGLFRIRPLCSSNFADAASNHRWTGKQQEKVIRSHDIFTLEPYSVNFIEGWLRH